MPALVSVVVLSYSRPSLLRLALEALSEQSYRDLDVIVVDNWSECSEEVRNVLRSFSSFRLLDLPENTGFTGGMNAGTRVARGLYTLLTEDDIILERDCIAMLVETFPKLQGAGLASGTIVDVGRSTIRYSGGFVRLRPGLQLVLPNQGNPDRRESSEPVTTGYIPGAFIFGRTDYLSILGPFRDDFFLYQEDVELCLRVLERGDTLWFVPLARCGHHTEQPAWTDPEIEVHKLKNSLAVYLLHATPDLLFEYLLRFGVQTFRAFCSSYSKGILHARAFLWAISSAPRLIHERRKRKHSSQGKANATLGQARP